MDEIGLWLSRNNDYDTFPRYINYRVRHSVVSRKVSSLDELMDYVRKFNTGIFVSIFSEWQYENNVYDTVFFDIDVGGNDMPIVRLEKAYEKVKLLRSKLLDIGYDFSRVYVSGRGFHCYVDFKPTVVSDYVSAYEQFLKRLGLSDIVDVDYLVFTRKNTKVYARFVGTMNKRVMSGIVVRRIDFTKDDVRDAFRGVADWKLYDDLNMFFNSV